MKDKYIVTTKDGRELEVMAYSEINAINEAVCEYDLETTDIIDATKLLF